MTLYIAILSVGCFKDYARATCPGQNVTSVWYVDRTVDEDLSLNIVSLS